MTLEETKRCLHLVNYLIALGDNGDISIEGGFIDPAKFMEFIIRDHKLVENDLNNRNTEEK